MAKSKRVIRLGEYYKKLGEDYQEYLLKLGYAPRSCRGRRNRIREFLSWLEEKGERQISQITSHRINQYYEYISERPSKKNDETLSQKTTRGHLRNVGGLFEMLLNQGRIKSNPTGTLNFPCPRQNEEREILDQREIQALYQAAETLQERAILSLAYGCGLRAGELGKCNVEDIRLEENILIVPKGKGKKRRVVPISPGVKKDLSSYYNEERESLRWGRDFDPRDSAFMLNSRGGRMRKWTWNKYLKRIINRTENERIKDKQITIHSLRHSIASHLIEQGIPVEQVRQFLGHSQLETTQIYTHINQKQIKKLLE